MQDLKAQQEQFLFTSAVANPTRNFKTTAGSSICKTASTKLIPGLEPASALGNSTQRSNRAQISNLSMNMGGPQNSIRNEIPNQNAVSSRSKVTMNMIKEVQGNAAMSSPRSKSTQQTMMRFNQNSKKVSVHETQKLESVSQSRSGSVGMRQRTIANENMEQSVNMQKFGATNKYVRAQQDKPTLAQAENQFEITGQKEQIQQVQTENFMDQQVELTPENILKTLKDMFEDYKTNTDMKKFSEEWGKKTLIAWAAVETFMQNPAPAFAAMLQQYSYTTFVQQIKDHMIEKVRLDPTGRTAEFLNVDGIRGSVNLFNDPGLLKLLQENGVDISVMPADPGPNPIFGVLSSLAFPFFILLGLFLISRRQGGPGGPGGENNPFNMGKSKAKIQMEPDTGVNFTEVAGVDEAKQELTEVVDFLKDPARYTALGAKIPRGVLLIGPPGTGKTLLAKAVAGEAGVPFISISASEFIEMFVGVGASRVRDMFEQAKKNAPCIVFIDELDSVGRQRAQGLGMGNDEREQTINQLLTEMDGFEGNKGVIVLAATNIPEVLDKALLRPGRFDRQVTVSLPDLKGRTTILGVHAKGKKLADSVNLEEIAKRCLGMSGADLANVLNEAAIIGAREQKTEITEREIYNAIDRIQIGLEKKGGTYSDERQKLVAYHEGGHALLGALMEEYDLVNKISIIPRGGAGGVTIFTPEEEAMESGMYSKTYLQNRICVAMGGRIAEEIINGKNKVTTGASNDFQQCTNTAKMMVEQMGMSDKIGPRNISQGAMSPMQAMMSGGSNEGADLKNIADQEIDRILAEQYDRGMKLLTDNRDVLDEIAKVLIEKEKINGKELLNVIKSIRPELVTQKAMEAVDAVMAPTFDDEPKLEPAPAQIKIENDLQKQQYLD